MFKKILCFLLVAFFAAYAYSGSDKARKTGFVPKTISVGGPGNSHILTGPQKGKPVDIAIGFLKANKAKLQVSDADIAALKVSDENSSRDTGATHIYLRQQFNGIEVFNANANVTVTKDGRVLNAYSSIINNLAGAMNRKVPAITAIEATNAAASYLNLVITEPLVTLSGRTGTDEKTTLSTGGISSQPIQTRLVFQPVSPTSVRLSWNVEINDKSGEHYWSVRVDAENKEVLSVADLVNNDSWKASSTPEKRQVSGVSAPNSPGSSSYNVFALPKENPDDGSRTVEDDPFDLLASPFGWHDTDGVAGAEFTVTRGNNAHAYTDINADNIADPGSDPDGGAGLSFDFPLDLTQQPSSYRPAAVTNLFYWNNIIHDVFYHYGFDEVSGNFQVNNYGHGGLANDDVRAEAQDGSGLNNANFFTPVDGSRPRMQMFVWTPPGNYFVTVNDGPIAGDYAAAPALFGTQLWESDPVTGDVALVNDGAGVSTTDACEPLIGFPAGQIALLDRGNCTFVVKVKNAQNAGAIGAIVANNVPGLVTMAGFDPTITIPALNISQTDGGLFKANLPLNATLKFEFIGEPLPARDSDLDAGVIGHEYTHGISNRLTGGPSTVSCLQNAEQMGEGWSDFSALFLTPNSTDGPFTSRGIGNYVIYEPSTGVGIRPTQYTTDMVVNPTTYSDLPTLIIPHGVGYAWTSMLWEVYWNLVSLHNFNPDVYGSWTTGGNNLINQLVIDGMKLQPCLPGFVDGRDAILQADQILTGGKNECAIWQGFAKRGLGFSASQGSSNSTTDGTAAFDLPSTCFSFGGFLTPLKPVPQLASANAGSTVRVKFSLSGDKGLDIFHDGYPISRQVSCDALAPTGLSDPTLTAGGAGLDYDSAIDQYNYPWQTLKAWKGTCREFVIGLNDGSMHNAYIQFK